MSLEIISSRNKDDELDSLFRKIASDVGKSSKNRPSKEQYFIVTPARLRPYVECKVLEFRQNGNQFPPKTIAGVGVHSFSSLVKSQIRTTDVKPILGNLTLRAYLSQCMRHDPETFREAGEVFGSINQFAQQITELVNAGVSSGDLMDSDDVRIQSLGRLLKAFENRFGNAYVLQGGSPLNAIAWVRENGGHLHFYLHGYERLTAAELRLVSEMAEHSNLTITDDETFSPDYLRVLRKKAMDGEIGLPEPKSNCGNVEVIPTADTAGEVRMAADRIQEKLETIPAGEILITARDLSPYRAILETEFASHGIALNSTPAATMADHPLADLLLGLLDPKLYEHEPQAILRIYRSGLIRGGLKVTRSELDRVENAFAHEDPEMLWKFQLPGKYLNESMRKISSLIDQAHSVFRPKTSGTVKEVLTGMVRFLVANKVNMSYKDLLNEDESREFMFAQTRQVWMKIMDALNELVENLGDEPYADFEPSFADNLESMLSMEPLSVKPKALNAVDVVAFPTAMRPYRYVYVLGASESQVPAIPHESGLLDDSERKGIAKHLESRGKHIPAEALLGSIVERKARREPLAFNRLLAYADSVTISCPKNIGNQAQEPSSYVLKLFGNEARNARNSDPRHEKDRALKLIDQPRHGIDPDTARKLFVKTEEGGGKPAFITSVSAMEEYYGNPYEYFLDHGLRIKKLEPFRLDAALEGTYYHSVLEHAIDLWMNDNRSSGSTPTVAEMCGYIDECSGLSATNKWNPSDEDPRLHVLESSNRMHAVHRQLVNNLKSFIEQLDAERAELVKNLAFDEKKIQDGKSKDKSPKTVNFVPLATEHEFGEFAQTKAETESRNKAWPYLEGSIVEGIPVCIRGKVDRIDAISVDGLPNDLLILDYKSSEKQLFGIAASKQSPDKDKGSKVFYGHELQLLTYALAARGNNPDKTIAGVMFLPIKRKKWEHIKIDSLGKKTLVRNENEKSFLTTMFTGPYTDDDGIALTPAKCGSQLNRGSMFIEHWAVNKHWHFEEDEAELLYGFVLSKIEIAAEHILGGDLPVRPYLIVSDDSQKSADGMRYSDYPAIMALDVIDDNLYYLQRPVTVGQLLGAAKALKQS